MVDVVRGSTLVIGSKNGRRKKRKNGRMNGRVNRKSDGRCNDYAKR